MGTFTRTHYCSICKMEDDVDGYESEDREDVLDHVDEQHGKLIGDTGRELATAISIRSSWDPDE